MKSPEKVIDHIINWLRSYADNSGMNGFVVGVSGGIDSQAIAFGFKSVNIDADYIYIRSSYNGH
ncbi:MAG: hypothetical protein ACPHVX_04810, partial [Flavobacteriaceae bacterium]